MQFYACDKFHNNQYIFLFDFWNLFLRKSLEWIRWSWIEIWCLSFFNWIIARLKEIEKYLSSKSFNRKGKLCIKVANSVPWIKKILQFFRHNFPIILFVNQTLLTNFLTNFPPIFQDFRKISKFTLIKLYTHFYI